MARPIIEVEDLSKLYRLGLIGATTLHDSLERWWCRIRGKEEICARIGAKNLMISSDDPQAGPEPNTLWALKNVSFSVQPGEVLGIIGKNGAGKSTLLKILSRITEPTRGRAIIRGKASSLLEVGTGFHPELTGRETVYLNGAILGMRKAEIEKKFNEKVTFAEIERFVDTPVKRYSSGMYVRLAFAVAAHLEPEILIIDEVLAVGDAAFQKKCIGKMGDAAKEGRTVLFVSHNMAAVTTLCSRSILLNIGSLITSGSSVDVIQKYLELDSTQKGEIVWSDSTRAPGNEKVRLRAVRVISDGKTSSSVKIDEPVYVELEFINYIAGANINTWIHLADAMGSPIFATGTPVETLSSGVYKTTYVIPAHFLNDCHYSINAYVVFDATNLEISEQQIIGFMVNDTAKREKYLGPIYGVIRPRIESKTVKLGS